MNRMNKPPGQLQANSLPSQVRGAPKQSGQLQSKNFIAIAPLPASEYDGEKVTARSSASYEQVRPSREEVRRSNYKRRLEQLSDQGFHSPFTSPYRELGNVELNDKRLMLRAVGQDERRIRLNSFSSGTDEPVDLSQFSSSSTIGLKIQANKSDLEKLTLQEQIVTAKKRLFDVKQGRGLFKLIKQEEEERLKRRQKAALEEARQLRATWKPADADEGAFPQRYSMTSVSRLSVVSDGGACASRSSSSRSDVNERARSSAQPSTSSLDALATMEPSEGSSALLVSSAHVDSSQRFGSAAANGSHPLDGFRSSTATPLPVDEQPANTSLSRTSLPSSDLGAGETSSEAALVQGRSLHQVELMDIPEDLEGEEKFLDTSSTRLRSMSHSSLASSDDGENNHDMEFMLRFLCVTKWILEGMLIENLATLPPVIYSWSPGKELETQRARVQFLEKQRHADEKWDKMLNSAISGSSGEKARAGTWHGGQRLMRHPKNKTPIIRGNNFAQRLVESPATLSSTDLSMHSEPPSFRATGETERSWAVRRSPSPGNGLQASSTTVQRKLTPEQMEWLISHINDQTHQFQRRRLKSSVGYQQATDSDDSESQIQYTPDVVSLDPVKMRQRFSNASTRKRLIVQTQLMAMERDRYQTCAQKFEVLTHLPQNGRLWSDMEKLRAGVATETAAMARRKLLMNYQWFQELENRLPESVRKDHRCAPVVRRLCDLYTTYVQIGPRRLNKAKLMKVLSCLRPWELEVPEICEAIEFVRNDVIYLSDREFANWKRRALQSRPTRAVFRKAATFHGVSTLVPSKIVTR